MFEIARVIGREILDSRGNPTVEVDLTLAGGANEHAENGGAADGSGAAAQFNSPADVAVDSSGNVYVADTDNNEIRMVTASGVVSTLAGVAGVIAGL